MSACPVTVHISGRKRGGRGAKGPCGQPLAEGASFCIKHEADRLRLLHTKPRNGRGGPDQERRYDLTRKGWIAATVAEHPGLGRTW